MSKYHDESIIGFKNWKLKIIDSKMDFIKEGYKSKCHVITVECECGNIKDIRKEDIFRKDRNYVTCGECSRNKFRKSVHGYYYVFTRAGDYFIIDYIDDKILNASWSKSDNGYYHSLGCGYIHRYIMSKFQNISNLDIDHINNNKSDNRIDNLRVASRSKNNMNCQISTVNTSGVNGVYYDKSRSKWAFQIRINGELLRCGRYELFDDAVINRVIGEVLYFKEYSNKFNHESQTIQLTYLSHDDNLTTFLEVSLEGDILQFTKLPN